MKRMICIVIVTLLLGGIAYAQVDLDGYGYRELVDLKVALYNKLLEYDMNRPEKETWYDDGSIKIVCSHYGIEDRGYLCLKFDFIIENNSEKTIWAGIKQDFINDWAVGTTGNICENGLAPGKKMLYTEKIVFPSKLNLKSEDLARYEYVFWVDADEEDWDNEEFLFNRTLDVFPSY